MRTTTIKFALASLMTLGAGIVLFLTLVPRLPALHAAPHEALGQVVAREAGKLLGAGGRVVLITRDTGTFLNPAVDAQMKSFARALKQAGVRVAATNLIKLDPLRVVSVPPGDFLQILKKASESDVVVSFLGPPALADEQIARLGDKGPKVVAVCTGELPRQVNLKRLFDQKVLHAAIVSRAPVAPIPPSSDQPQAWFDYLFAVVTPANLGELPPASVK